MTQRWSKQEDAAGKTFHILTALGTDYMIVADFPKFAVRSKVSGEYGQGGKLKPVRSVAGGKRWVEELLARYERGEVDEHGNGKSGHPSLDEFDGFQGDSDMQSIHDFIRKHDLHMSSKPDHSFVPKDEWQRSASHWTCTIEKIGKYDAHATGKLTTSFHMGSAHSGEPEIADVLSSLALDASSALSAQDAYDMARDLGMELETAQDKLKARNIYSACTATHRKLVKLLGEAATKELIYETEPL